MAGDTVVNVKADTAQDFLDAGHKAMRDDAKLGETTYNIDVAFNEDGKTGKVTKVSFTLSTSIKRVHWSGAAKTKPDKANADAIQKIEKLLKAHEEEHRDGYNKVFNKLKPEMEKALVGKTKEDIQKSLETMNEALRDECESLHKRGGLIELKEGSGGTLKVSESAEGPGGCS